MDRSRLASLPPSALADTLLALAAAPALPAADWSMACRTLLASAATAVQPPGTGVASSAMSSSGLRLQAATLLFALSHGSVPSLGLGTLLEDFVAPARFAVLPPAVQGLLLARLPALLRSLAAKRAAAVVQALPGLLTAAAATAAATVKVGGCADAERSQGADADAPFPWHSTAGLDDPALQLTWLRRVRQSLGPLPYSDGGAGTGIGSSSSSGTSAWLAAHCWLGLLGVCRAWQAKDAMLVHRDITQAAHSTIASLASLLPPLPSLQPGEAAQLMAWAAGANASGGGGGSAAAAAAAVTLAAGGDDWNSYGPSGRPLALEAPAEEAANAPPLAALTGLAGTVRHGSCGGGGGRTSDAVRATVTLWSLAVCCLRCLRPDFLTAQILAAETAAAAAEAEAPPTSLAAAAVASLQLRCVLVATGHVSYRELMPVRTAAAMAAVTVTSTAMMATAAGEGDVLLVPLSLALTATPQTFQVRW
ncbi:hypothetical protein Agub_g8754, partial [Astrephomene gubernaculifera]